jgi:hypothetical protein
MLREARSCRQESVSAHLGQRFLAHKPLGEKIARKNNCEVKSSGDGVRIVSCLLPKQSLWMNAIEPKWVHGKRKVDEPDGLVALTSLPRGSVGSSIVRATSIYSFPRRLPDYAPGYVYWRFLARKFFANSL